MSRQLTGIAKGKENSKLMLYHDNKKTPSKDSQVETPQVQESRACYWGLGEKGSSETSFGKQAATGNHFCCWVCRSDLNKVLASLHRAAGLSSVRSGRAKWILGSEVGEW